MEPRDVWDREMGKYNDIATLRARLEWVYAQCNDPARTTEEIGRDICAVIAGGRVGRNIYPDSDSAIDAAIAQERN